ncbi:hypothetical protein [Algibacillus agarilyticus]|uniref:hypothetical protein n=1 Tax=Algibacillus agarilyticus TaxID=2234133 RepID=UPI000DCFD1E3|nr:hypothetical protein [Algibacillus agarilyticus]
MKKMLTWTIALSVSTFAFSAQAGWHFGTGFGVTVQQGELTFKTQDFNQQQHQFIGDVEVNSSDIAKSLLSFDGYGTNGRWRIDYRYIPNKLSQTVENDSFAFDSAVGAFSFGHRIVKLSGGKHLFVNLGIRVNQQEFMLQTANEKLEIDSSWIDATMGLKADIPITNKLVIHAGADAGVGDAETSYNAHLAVNYRFSRKWSLIAKAETQKLEYEYNQIDKVEDGKSDWFTSEFDSTSVSLRFIRIW